MERLTNISVLLLTVLEPTRVEFDLEWRRVDRQGRIRFNVERPPQSK